MTLQFSSSPPFALTDFDWLKHSIGGIFADLNLNYVLLQAIGVPEGSRPKLSEVLKPSSRSFIVDFSPNSVRDRIYDSRSYKLETCNSVVVIDHRMLNIDSPANCYSIGIYLDSKKSPSPNQHIEKSQDQGPLPGASFWMTIVKNGPNNQKPDIISYKILKAGQSLVDKSSGEEPFYSKFGDYFATLCAVAEKFVTDLNPEPASPDSSLVPERRKIFLTLAETAEVPRDSGRTFCLTDNISFYKQNVLKQYGFVRNKSPSSKITSSSRCQIRQLGLRRKVFYRPFKVTSDSRDSFQNITLNTSEPEALSRLEAIAKLFPLEIVDRFKNGPVPLYYPSRIRQTFLTAPSLKTLREVCELVPAEPLLDSLIRSGLNLRCAELLKAMLSEQLPYDREGILNPDSATIHFGDRHKLEESCWGIPPHLEVGWNLVIKQFPSQNRRHYLCFYNADEKGKVLEKVIYSVKGGGVIVRKPEIVHHYHEPDEILPFYSTNYGSVQMQFDFCEVYGGLNYSCLKEEIGFLLALYELVKLAGCDELQRILPIPRRLGALLEIPVATLKSDGSSSISWFSAEGFKRKYLKDPNVGTERICTFGEEVPSEHRVSEIFRRIFVGSPQSQQNAALAKPEIDDALRAFYETNGEVLEIPSHLATVRPLTSPKFVLLYLKALFMANKESAIRIEKRFSSLTLKLIALVHGANGHLGSGRYNDPHTNQSEGSLYGGALAPRNVDLAAGIHDLSDGSFPWLKEGISDIAIDPRKTTIMQGLDLVHWCATNYLINCVLKGGVRGTCDTERIEFYCDESNEATVFKGDPQARHLIGLLKIAGGADDSFEVYFNDVQLLNLYREYREIGAKAVTGL